MALKQWSIAYFLKGQAPDDDGSTFGCGVEGIAGVDASAARWDIRPVGECLAGSYEGVLEELAGLTAGGFRPDAAVVFFARAPGMEEFLRRASRRLPGIPWGGGGAAYNPAAGMGELLPAARDVILLLICDSRYRFENAWLNVHGDTARRVSFRAGGPRTILALREDGGDLPAQKWYKVHRQAFGFCETGFENLALAWPEGWNLHASPEGEFALRTGADLPMGGELAVRAVENGMATERVAAFCGKENTLVFGCAGLMALLERPVIPGDNTLAGFLHGEVLTANGSPRFANLMMSGLTARVK